MGRVNATGRNTTSGPHVRIFAYMSGTDAWKAMTGNAIKVLLYVAAHDDGKNNGAIFMSERRASEGAGLDRKTVRRALLEACEKGFLEQMSAGSFRAKNSPAATWRLTWKSAPPLSMGATHDYRKWRPDKEKSRGEKLPTPGPNSPPPNAAKASRGGNNSPRKSEQSRKSAIIDLGEMGPQIIASVGALPRGPCCHHYNPSRLGVAA